MEIASKELFDVILEFNQYLTRSVAIIAVGGTALTLLGKKSSTKDIDLCFLNESNRDIFIRTAKRLGYNYRSTNQISGKGIVIDIYIKGYIFAVQLQNDYFKKSVLIEKMEKINLYTLSPTDIIISKTARLNKRDEEDIISILKNYEINQQELVDRYLATMKNSMVRDDKDHLLVLFSIIKKYKAIDKTALQNAERWANE